MKIITATLLIFAMTCLAHARLHQGWSYQELYAQADLVVIAKPISTQDTTEKATLPNGTPGAYHVVGLSTEFEISVVLKGDNSLKKVTLHHYRLADSKSKEPLINGPSLVSFYPKQDIQFLMFLRLEGDGRYSPVSGQIDPDMSVLWLLQGISVPPPGIPSTITIGQKESVTK